MTSKKYVFTKEEKTYFRIGMCEFIAYDMPVTKSSILITILR